MPLCLATSRAEFQVIDKWENMVYIDAFSHAKITQNNNANFSDFNDCIVHCENHTNIKYDTEKQELMLDYNKRILDSKV